MAGLHTNYFKRKALDDVKAANRYQYLRLFQNDFTPDEGSEVGDFTEADFDGYGAVALSFAAAFLNGDEQGQLNASSVTFTRGSGAESNDVYGVYVTDSDGEVTFFEKFPSPIAMETEGEDFIEYQFSPTSDDEA
jgi:hypothetical protein